MDLLEQVRVMLPQWIEKEGLPFACTGCGKCCTGAPGYIWVNDEEIDAIADQLNLSRSDFLANYTEEVEGRVSLLELPERNNDCIFLEGKGCTIYDVRPTQCRTYPFWPDNIKSPRAWRETAFECEGIYPDAKKVDRQTILEKTTTTFLA